ncbi:hypothetical protein ABIF62_007696 [Bradyrhizobium japonicum]
MSEEPTKRIPDWLEVDLVLIAASLAVIVVGFWIAP